MPDKPKRLNYEYVDERSKTFPYRENTMFESIGDAWDDMDSVVNRMAAPASKPEGLSDDETTNLGFDYDSLTQQFREAMEKKDIYRPLEDWKVDTIDNLDKKLGKYWDTMLKAGYSHREINDVIASMKNETQYSPDRVRAIYVGDPD